MMTLGASIDKGLISPGTFWQIQSDANAYGGAVGDELVTQVAEGRRFQLIEPFSKDFEAKNDIRFKVRLLEDGYLCWLDLADLICSECLQTFWEPLSLKDHEIQQRLQSVVTWVEKASRRNNKYLWGGTLGPDFDCSGLVQTAFASEGIWLPRDAYQQERFCDSLFASPSELELLRLGDLIFFGTQERCDHVGIYVGQGFYWHSSGKVHGRNGIGSDQLDPKSKNHVSSYYCAKFRGAGRVNRCHDGTSLP